LACWVTCYNLSSIEMKNCLPLRMPLVCLVCLSTLQSGWRQRNEHSRRTFPCESLLSFVRIWPSNKFRTITVESSTIWLYQEYGIFINFVCFLRESYNYIIWLCITFWKIENNESHNNEIFYGSIIGSSVLKYFIYFLPLITISLSL
jgi:hypothetical protein